MTQKLLFLIFLLAPSWCFAQLDSTFVESIPDSKTFAFHTTLKDFQISFSTNSADQITFQNNTLGIGFRAKYKKIGLSLSVPIVAFNKSPLGNPQSFTLGLPYFFFCARFFSLPQRL